MRLIGNEGKTAGINLIILLMLNGVGLNNLKAENTRVVLKNKIKIHYMFIGDKLFFQIYK